MTAELSRHVVTKYERQYSALQELYVVHTLLASLQGMEIILLQGSIFQLANNYWELFMADGDAVSYNIHQ